MRCCLSRPCLWFLQNPAWLRDADRPRESHTRLAAVNGAPVSPFAPAPSNSGSLEMSRAGRARTWPHVPGLRAAQNSCDSDPDSPRELLEHSPQTRTRVPLSVEETRLWSISSSRETVQICIQTASGLLKPWRDSDPVDGGEINYRKWHTSHNELGTEQILRKARVKAQTLKRPGVGGPGTHVSRLESSSM